MSNDPHHDDDSLQGTSKSCFSVVLPACVVVTCHSHVSAVAWSPNSADMMGMNQPFNLFINMPDKLSHFLSIELNEKFSTPLCIFGGRIRTKNEKKRIFNKLRFF